MGFRLHKSLFIIQMKRKNAAFKVALIQYDRIFPIMLARTMVVAERR